jgi:hypothetical protein
MLCATPLAVPSVSTLPIAALPGPRSPASLLHGQRSSEVVLNANVKGSPHQITTSHSCRVTSTESHRAVQGLDLAGCSCQDAINDQNLGITVLDRSGCGGTRAWQQAGVIHATI